MKISVTIAIILAMAVFIYGCARGEASAEEILDAICAELELPSGEKYVYIAEEGSRGYFSAEEMRDIYGKDAEEIFSLTSDYALYFSSFACPYEAAVIKCRSRSDTDRVAAMLRERAEENAVLLRDTEFRDVSENTIVYINGRYVIAVSSNDRESASNAVKKAIG